MIMVSSCLVGLKCKYNGESCYNEKIAKLVENGKAILVCPEQMGGCSTPRNPCEIATNATGADILSGIARIVDIQGNDHTCNFLNGATETLKVAQLFNIDIAILKSKSPSCGSGEIYDGTFSRKLIEGNGVTAEILLRNGYRVYTENNYPIDF